MLASDSESCTLREHLRERPFALAMSSRGSRAMCEAQRYDLSWSMQKRSALALGLASLFAAALSGPAKTARAGGPRFGPNDIRALFAIAKNIDRDEVRYAIRLDKDCMPVGDAPLHAYWQQIEQGPDVVEDLNILDRTVYGIEGQWILKRTADESKVLMTLKATPKRGIAVITRKRDGKCVADSIATINGKPAHLESVFVHIPGFLKVDWIEIKGTDVAASQPVVERVKH